MTETPAARGGRYGVVLALVLSACAGLAGAADATQVAGYRRNGTGIYPDAKPPVKFAYPADLRWETLLPSWGHGSPIVVGGKVFAMVEPCAENCWPQLVALDVKTGKEAWRATLSAGEAAYPTDKAKRAEVEACMQGYNDALVAFYRARLQGSKEKFNYKIDKALRPMCSRDTWYSGAGCRGVNAVGDAYPTPVSDGEHVYVATAHNVFACFALDGTRKWIRHVPGHGGEYCRCGRSPIIHRDLLISDLRDTVRAFDRATGKLVWSDDLGAKKHSTIVSPMVMTVEGQDILFAAGCNAYLLPGGKKLQVEGWKDPGMQTLVKHDEPDVIFFCGAGEHCGWEKKGKGVKHPPPAAVRFALAGDTLKGTVLWSGVDGKHYGGNKPWMFYDRGRLYAPGAGALDALTGKVVFGAFGGKRGRGTGPVPASNHLLQAAGGHLYGVVGKTGTVQVCTLDGKPVSACKIPPPKPEGAELELIKTCERKLEWPGFSKGGTFTFGPDCLVVRGMARLYCFGK